jgi:hypothetical protein
MIDGKVGSGAPQRVPHGARYGLEEEIRCRGGQAITQGDERLPATSTHATQDERKEIILIHSERQILEKLP